MVSTAGGMSKPLWASAGCSQTLRKALWKLMLKVAVAAEAGTSKHSSSRDDVLLSEDICRFWAKAAECTSVCCTQRKMCPDAKNGHNRHA